MKEVYKRHWTLYTVQETHWAVAVAAKIGGGLGRRGELARFIFHEKSVLMLSIRFPDPPKPVGLTDA